MRGTTCKGILGALLFALGGLVGCATARRYPADCVFCNNQPHQSHSIAVDAAGNADKECAVVSKKAKDTITWNVNANWTAIRFLLKNGQTCPFVAGGKTCQFPVIAGKAQSGPVSDTYDTSQSPELRCYKYAPALSRVGALEAGADPEVMIDP